MVAGGENPNVKQLKEAEAFAKKFHCRRVDGIAVAIPDFFRRCSG